MRETASDSLVTVQAYRPEDVDRVFAAAAESVAERRASVLRGTILDQTRGGPLAGPPSIRRWRGCYCGCYCAAGRMLRSG